MSFQQLPWRRSMSAACRRITFSSADVVIPSGEVSSNPARDFRSSDATRIMKNSSRLVATMARNLTRSSGGWSVPVACSSTRSLKRSQLSSRLISRPGSVSAGPATAPAAGRACVSEGESTSPILPAGPPTAV